MDEYRKYLGLLAPLESFDPAAFNPDKKYSSELCDFILGLALVYNDFRDVVVCLALVATTRPVDLLSPTPELGQVTGVHAHLIRLQAGLLHEFAAFLDRHRSVLDDSRFKALIRQLHPEAREAWQKIVSSLESVPGNDPLSRVIFFARNKIGYHYDRKEIRKGYTAAFGNFCRDPYISRADSMAGTRFYFADAAADEYFRSLASEQVVNGFGTGAEALISELNHSLREIVIKFINARGIGFRAIKGKPGSAT